MAVALRELRDAWIWAMRDLPDPRTKDFFFINSLPIVVMIIVSYLYFAKDIGPKLMQNVKPFNLKYLMIFYNMVQIVTCGYMLIKAFPLWFRYDWTCAEIPGLEEDFSVEKEMAFLFYSLKYLDLLDTVFFVLRKKQNQITFLHVAHHSGMIFIAWVGVKYVPGGQSFYILFINTFVHFVMYSYYLITALNENARKQVWWKKYLTQLQLLQFASLIFLFTSTLIKPGCKFPWPISFAIIVQNFMIGILFSDYYYRAHYLKKK